MEDCIVFLYEKGYDVGSNFCTDICPKYEACLNGDH